MAFTDVNPRQSFPEMEVKWIKHWKENDTFQKSIDNRKDAETSNFYDGPPFATGLPHYGHILAGTMKDVVPRYHTMRGYKVDNRVFGWDCHGLPIENLIEKDLGLKTKQDIEEEFGIDKFNEACRASVLKYTSEWEQTVNRMGRWVDFKNDYKTMDPYFMESIWWVFKQLWNKDLIYKGRKSMHICPRCVTPLSNFEVTLGYADITDYSVTSKFKLDNPPKGQPEGEYYVLAWTTTPWTLPGNMYLAVGEDIAYAIYKVNDELLILAKNLEEYVFGEDEREHIADITAADMVGLTYEPLFPYFANLKENGKFRIEIGSFVDDSDGTGVVHIAGGYGEDDMEFAKKFGEKDGSDVVRHVNMEGHFIEEVTDFPREGVKPKDDPTKMDRRVGKWLEEHGKLFKGFNYKHSYPHCWRCDSPLLNYATDAWFVSIDAVKKTMLEENSKVHWVPDHVGSGRFHQWLENARDWCISRNRYWGTPLPVWIGEKTGEAICIGSIEELEMLSGQKVDDLHKHFTDNITFEYETKILVHPGGIREPVIPADAYWDTVKETYHRIPEVLDCWFESGSMPYAQKHYPFENKEWFEGNFPAEFIAEGLDQTRGWFYTLMVLGCGLFEKSPYKNVIVNGMILAEDGKKMSKRLKNYPDPGYMFDEYGADALRFYLMNSPVVRAEPLRFSEKGVADVVRRILLPLWNSYSFFVTYANIDGWKPSDDLRDGSKAPKSDHKLDRWVMSELELLLKELTEEMDNYDLQKASTPIASFIDSLTNWYIRRSRRRFWKSESDTDKENAYSTLYYCLVRLSQIMAPFTPFITEEIYTNLTGNESVHLSDWPEFNSDKIDEELNKEVQLTQHIVALGHAIRAQKKIKVRQPLKEVQVALPQGWDAIKFELDIIEEELNVKQVAVLKVASDIANTVVKPNAKKLGPKYGGAVQQIIKEAKSGNFEKLEDGKMKVLEFTLEPDEYEIAFEGKAGLDVASENGIVVALDTELTDELRMEGVARDAVRTIQDMRKEVDYNVSDRITTFIFAQGGVCQALETHAEYIRQETLTESLTISTVDEVKDKNEWDLWKEVEIEGEQLQVGVKGL